MDRCSGERFAQQCEQLASIGGGEPAQYLVLDLGGQSSGPLERASARRHDRDLPRAAIVRTAPVIG
ncbi:MAG: hypothetical protein ACTHQQ_05430 [Solirubrobacteraceae bacterium]